MKTTETKTIEIGSLEPNIVTQTSPPTPPPSPTCIKYVNNFGLFCN